jgi:hypothetical protein
MIYIQTTGRTRVPVFFTRADTESGARIAYENNTEFITPCEYFAQEIPEHEYNEGLRLS